MGQIYLRQFPCKPPKNSDVTVVYNKKTGKAHTRRKSKNPLPVPNEEQKQLRKSFGERSHMAATWLKANNPEACPPSGTKEYQSLRKKFDKQDHVPTMLHFIMTRISRYGEVK